MYPAYSMSYIQQMNLHAEFAYCDITQLPADHPEMRQN